MIRNLIGNGILTTCYVSWLQGEYESIWYLIAAVALFTILNNSAKKSGVRNLINMDYDKDNNIPYSMYSKYLFRLIAVMTFWQITIFTIGIFVLPTLTCIICIILSIIIIVEFLIGKHHDEYELLHTIVDDLAKKEFYNLDE